MNVLSEDLVIREVLYRNVSDASDTVRPGYIGYFKDDFYLRGYGRKKVDCLRELLNLME
jgi:hypothetical protein